MEEWRDIEGYEGLYQVSDLGRVKALPRYKKNHSVMEWKEERILKPSVSKKLGYKTVALWKDGKQRTRYVHVIVCQAFHGPKPTPVHEAAHFDGIRLNNVPGNLRWATRPDNINDTMRHDMVPKGSNHHGAVVNENQVREMRALYDKGIRVFRIADEFNVKYETVHSIVKRRSWAWLT